MVKLFNGTKSFSTINQFNKISLSRNRLNIKAPYSKLNINVLKILYHEGYIRGFKVSHNQLPYIFI